MQPYFFFLLLFLTLNTTIYAQLDDEMIDSATIVNTNPSANEQKEKPFKVDNLFVGLDASLLLGNAIYVDISPYAGYLLNRYIGVGVGGTYIYSARLFNQKYVGQSVYGVRAFVKLRPLPNASFLRNIYLHVEGEYLNHTVIYNNTKTKREFVPAVNLGVGYNLAFEEGFSINTLLLINPLWFKQSASGKQPVRNFPWEYRVGIYYAF